MVSDDYKRVKMENLNKFKWGINRTVFYRAQIS